jgi:uncharacterized repeat protein (TIGR01451 family)
MQAAVAMAEPKTTLQDDRQDEPQTNVEPDAADRQAREFQSQSTAAIPTGQVASLESSTPAATVARGQEPNEAADNDAIESVPLETIDISDDASSTQGEVADSDTAEPQPLDMPADGQPMNTAAKRAREAFRDETPTTSSDRYGAPAAAAVGQSPSAKDPASVNPFAMGSTSNSPEARRQGTIETLPPLAGQGATPGTASGQANNDSTARVNQGASAPIGTAPSRLGGRPQDASFGGLPNSAGDAVPGVATGGQIADGIGEGASSITGTGRPGERALEGPQNSSLVIQKLAPAEIQVGKPAKFVVKVRNAGNQVADQVEVRDEVPQGTRLISTSPSAQADGNQLVWQLGKLSAGEERSFEIQLMPTAEGEVGSVATVSYSAQASVKTRCTMPQLAVRMTAPDKVLIGQQQPVKIELRNPGSGDATGVMLFENVPPNLKHAAGPALEFEIGTLRAGETRELELMLTAEKPGKVVNTLTARADGNLQVQQQVEFEVIAPALEVAVEGPLRRYLERPATYEVSVQNPGTAPAFDVQIVTKLPKGMRFVRANNMGEYDATSHAVYWSLAELPEGERGTVELVAMPVETGEQTLEVETRSGQGLADEAKQQIVVEGLAAMMFEVRDLEDPIEVGGETGYEIRVVNQGTKAATNVRVAVTLPPGMQLMSAEGETQYATQGGVLAFEPLPQLAPKSESVFRIRAQGVRAGDQRVTVEVQTDDLTQPIRREESTRVFGDE